MWWMIGTTLILVLLAWLMMMPIRTDFLYHCQGTDGAVQARISAFGGLFSWTVKEKAPERKIKQFWPWFVEMIDRIRNAKPALMKAVSYLLSKTRVNQLSCQTKFGTGDAALTGVLSGLVWAGSTNLFSWFSQQVKQVKSLPSVSVVPVFAETTFTFEIRCIFEVRLGHIIIAGYRALRRARQRRG